MVSGGVSKRITAFKADLLTLTGGPVLMAGEQNAVGYQDKRAETKRAVLPSWRSKKNSRHGDAWLDERACAFAMLPMP